ncbi:MAG: C40 family peptidase [Deltaproteobacteria bacterium]|nr:C40 family peptidase [Deltaproteobacteria bacterium]
MNLHRSAQVRFSIILLLLLFVTGCTRAYRPIHNTYTPVTQKPIKRLDYTIQVGAFSDVNNAVRLSDELNERGLDAYHYVDSTKLYKVRFGNFLFRDDAHREAVLLKAMGVIDGFYIVSPSEYSIVKGQKYGQSYVRSELVKTAKAFIGIPYRWGGSSFKKGFDCSGLAMAVYKLNGLNLPRTSRQQYQTGVCITRKDLSRGDLVFFDTSGGGNVSHVGIYVGDGKFIHAPKKGKTVRVSSLSSRYYSKRYVGARSYL